VSSKAVMTEADIVNAEVVQVDLGPGLLLQVTPTAARDSYRLTGANQGKRLVLTLNDVALGARQIEAPMAEGSVMIFVEMTDAALDDLVRDLKRTSAEVQRQISREIMKPGIFTLILIALTNWTVLAAERIEFTWPTPNPAWADGKPPASFLQHAGSGDPASGGFWRRAGAAARISRGNRHRAPRP